MPKNIKRFRRVFLLFLLFSVTTRVLTGAAEAQVNFTSLVIDHQLKQSNSVDHELLLYKSLLKNSESASSIPEKIHTYATYKKYLTPDSDFSIILTAIERKQVYLSLTDYLNRSQPNLFTLLPVANSPPTDTSSELWKQMPGTSIVENMENVYGEFEINNSAGGLSRL